MSRDFELFEGVVERKRGDLCWRVSAWKCFFFHARGHEFLGWADNNTDTYTTISIKISFFFYLCWGKKGHAPVHLLVLFYFFFLSYCSRSAQLVLYLFIFILFLLLTTPLPKIFAIINMKDASWSAISREYYFLRKMYLISSE